MGASVRCAERASRGQRRVQAWVRRACGCGSCRSVRMLRSLSAPLLGLWEEARKPTLHGDRRAPPLHSAMGPRAGWLQCYVLLS